MNTSRSILIISMLAALLNVSAQDFVRMNHALKVEAGLPIAVYNPAFKEFVQGVAFTHINYQYRVFGNDKFSPTVGLGLSGNYLDIANYKIVGLNQGGLFSYGGNISFGAEIIHDETLISNFHIRGGYFMMESRNKQTPTNIPYFSKFEHIFIEPGASLTIMLDERQGFSFHASYTFRDMKFNKHHLMIAELPGFVTSNLGGITGHLNFGFGYTMYLQKPKNTPE
jgi:hypothetical protein